MADQMANLGPNPLRTNLLDVVYDCLEQIFVHLTVRDLLNIAHTNKDLKQAADMAFKRKFGKIEFELHNDRYFILDTNIIRINDKKTQLRLLRCFGHSITKLDIQPSGEFGKKLMSYVNEYCFTSLVAIRIQQSLFDWLPKNQFSNVEVVDLINCPLYADCIDFNQCFPAMRQLALKWCSFANVNYTVKNLPKLEHLAIVDTRYLSPDIILAWLQLNPQLRTLFLEGIVLPIHFWSACQSITQLECLHVLSYNDQLFSYSDTVHFSALEKLHIFIKYDRDLDVMKSKIMFDRLKDITLEFGLFVDLADTYQWSKFFKKNKSIEKVHLMSEYYEIKESTMTAIAQELPLLREIVNFAGWFSADEILDFMGKFNLLRYGFKLENEDEFKDLQNRLGAQWSVSIHDEYFVKIDRKLW